MMHAPHSDHRTEARTTPPEIGICNDVPPLSYVNDYDMGGTYRTACTYYRDKWLVA